MAKVKFFAVDLKTTFEALTTKDEFALYWIVETQELYKGELLFAVGKEATTATAGLMSAEDKRKLDTLSDIEGGIHFFGVSSTDPKDGVITIDGEVVTPIAGDIIIYGTKEYICDKNGNFVELGDESIYLTEEKANELFQTKAEASAQYEELQNKIDAIPVDDIKANTNEVITLKEQFAELEASMVWESISG